MVVLKHTPTNQGKGYTQLIKSVKYLYYSQLFKWLW
jgi:hypothetical protein